MSKYELLNLPSLDRIDADWLDEFCRRWKVTELAVFGSALRSDFRTDSDIDFLVTFANDAPWGLFDHVRMRDELADRFGRDVDLVSRSAVERSRNPFRKGEILRTAETIYAA